MLRPVQRQPRHAPIYLELHVLEPVGILPQPLRRIIVQDDLLGHKYSQFTPVNFGKLHNEQTDASMAIPRFQGTKTSPCAKGSPRPRRHPKHAVTQRSPLHSMANSMTLVSRRRKRGKAQSASSLIPTGKEKIPIRGARPKSACC